MAVFLFFAAPLLLAQDSSVNSKDKVDTKDEKAAWDTETLQEITVTAERRGASLQKTALAVTPLSEELLEDITAENTRDLGAITPGLVVSNNAEFGRTYIRGIGTENVWIGSDGSVAFHLDGVYMARPATVYMDFLDLERVEVLRGPQGTLYGRNSAGGSINFISKPPTLDRSAKVDFQFGNYDRLRARASVNLPLKGDELSMRFSVMESKYDGFVDNPEPVGPDRLQDKNAKVARLSFFYTPDETWELQLSADTVDLSGTGIAMVPSTPGLAAALGARVITDPFVVANTASDNDQDKPGPFADTALYGYTFKAKKYLDNGMSLSSTTAYRANRFDRFLDTDGTEIDIIDFRQAERHDQISEEIQLSSRTGEKFEWIAGLYLFTEDMEWNGYIRLPLGTPTDVAEPTIISNSGSEMETIAYAAFFQGTYRQSSVLSYTFGVRYSYEEKDFIGYNGPVQMEKNDWSDVTPKFSVNIQPNENQLFYISATRGFKSGGFNGTLNQKPFDEETVWSYEVGSKSSLLGNKLRLNSSLFHYDYEDLQVQSFVATGTIIDNAAGATIQGLELEMSTIPVTGLQLTANAAFLDAEYDEFLFPDAFLGVVDLSGGQMPLAPDLTLGAAAKYSMLVMDGPILSYFASYRWQDDTPYRQIIEETTTQKAYGLLDARIELESAGGKWHFSAWGKNLTDKHYYTAMVKLGFTPEGVVSFNGDPRTYGLQVGYKY